MRYTWRIEHLNTRTRLCHIFNFIKIIRNNIANLIVNIHKIYLHDIFNIYYAKTHVIKAPENYMNLPIFVSTVS